MDIYSALGNKVRVKLVLCLAEREKCVQEMIDVCGLAQSAVSQHLEKLREAGVVAFERKGRNIYYSLVDHDAVEIARLLLQLDRKGSL